MTGAFRLKLICCQTWIDTMLCSLQSCPDYGFVQLSLFVYAALAVCSGVKRCQAWSEPGH